MFVALLIIAGGSGASAYSNEPFLDNFEADKLSNAWLVAHKQWGGSAAGSVVADNVAARDGKLVLTAHGDLYEGPTRGINKDMSPRPDGKRTGGAVATNLYYASGSYEVRMKVAPTLGICSAIWTFQYQESASGVRRMPLRRQRECTCNARRRYYPGDPEYEGGGEYYAINHEIDIELPGRPGAAHEDISFDRALMNTWRGERDDEYQVTYASMPGAQDDGNYHNYRFDWHTESADPRVEFYVDGVLVATNRQHVPTLAGRLWIAAWFPDSWAGDPAFETSELLVDWVRITPFLESGDRWNPESFPDDGWADSSGPASEVLYDDFASGLSPDTWLVAEKNWGGQLGATMSYNGGVLAENVALRDGQLVLTARGDLYEGPVRGINKDMSARTDGKRTGAAIATNAYFASGSYEVRMKVAPTLGVCSAIWTFHYQEFYPDDPEYVSKPVGGDDYYAVNHEIDIELPGRPGPANVDIGFDRALMNTWVGENDDEYLVTYAPLPSAQDDGAMHTYRFDWHTTDPRVEFYVDGVLVATNRDHIPNIASRLWIAAWFPRGWAGTPQFETSEVVIDWVRITPFLEDGDEWSPESFPNDGWSPRYPKDECPAEPAPTLAPAQPAPEPTPKPTTTTHKPTLRPTSAAACLMCHACGGDDYQCPPSTYCRANDVCQGYPDYASFDPNGLCCGTTATPRPTSLRGTTPPTDDGGCLACHACGGSADCPATSYCRGNGVCQGFPDYSSFDPRGECCARP